MRRFYLIVCGLIALFLPHLADDSVSTSAQIQLQIAFLLVGWFGFKTFQSNRP